MNTSNAIYWSTKIKVTNQPVNQVIIYERHKVNSHHSYWILHFETVFVLEGNESMNYLIFRFSERINELSDFPNKYVILNKNKSMALLSSEI